MYPPSAAAAAAWSDGTLPLANGPGRGAVLWRLVRHRAMERRGLGLIQSPMLIMRPVLPPLEVSYLREGRVHAPQSGPTWATRAHTLTTRRGSWRDVRRTSFAVALVCAPPRAHCLAPKCQCQTNFATASKRQKHCTLWQTWVRFELGNHCGNKKAAVLTEPAVLGLKCKVFFGRQPRRSIGRPIMCGQRWMQLGARERCRRGWINGGAGEGVDQEPTHAAALLLLVCMAGRHFTLCQRSEFGTRCSAGYVCLCTTPAVVPCQAVAVSCYYASSPSYLAARTVSVTVTGSLRRAPASTPASVLKTPCLRSW